MLILKNFFFFFLNTSFLENSKSQTRCWNSFLLKFVSILLFQVLVILTGSIAFMEKCHVIIQIRHIFSFMNSQKKIQSSQSDYSKTVSENYCWLSASITKDNLRSTYDTALHTSLISAWNQKMGQWVPVHILYDLKVLTTIFLVVCFAVIKENTFETRKIGFCFTSPVQIQAVFHVTDCF